MAGEIQLNSTTMATESSGTITLSNVNSATNRTNLGLGSIVTQAADSVAISGGNITGGTIGSGVVFPAGHILQVQRGARDKNGISVSTAATVDTVTKSITTVAANSTILVVYDGQSSINGPSNMYTVVVLNRTGGTSGDGDIVPATDVRQLAAQGVSANSLHTMGQTYTHIDSPAVAAGTTLTYKIKQTGSPDSETSIVGANCSLVLFEIAA